jgi:hypothetical protein
MYEFGKGDDSITITKVGDEIDAAWSAAHEAYMDLLPIGGEDFEFDDFGFDVKVESIGGESDVAGGSDGG